MYGIALSVAACLRAGTRVDVAWAVHSADIGTFDPTDAVALTPGGGRMGSLLSGAADAHLHELASRHSSSGRVVDVEISVVDAAVAGLPHPGRVRLAIAPATALPADLWQHLVDRDPVCLASTVVEGVITATELRPVPDPGAPATVTEENGELLTVLVPTVRLLVLGTGPMAAALADAAALLGWRVTITDDADTAVGLAAACAPMDSIVVMAHDLEAAGRTLAAALASPAGYIGALGAPRMQDARAEWLAYRGITDIDRIHGPAGLDIGARTPGEVAVAILAEAIAARTS